MPLFAQIANRLDWFDYGVASINRTGAFIACLIMACWAVSAMLRKWSFWCSLALSAVFMYYLIQTQSRGSFLALVGSYVVFLYFSKIKLSAYRITAVFCLCAVAFIYSQHLGFAKRMLSMFALESSAANCRAEIYLSGVKMLTDAPNGFENIESPSEIYKLWYQSIDDSDNYISLINSHLDFMCMYGITAKLGYILFWTLILAATFPRRGQILASVAFCTWLCFFISSIFSNVANYWVLWIIPIILLPAIYMNRHRFIKRKFWLTVALIFTIATATLYAVSAMLPRDSKLNFREKEILVGEYSDNPVLILHPNMKIMGSKYGKSLALYTKDKGGFIVVSDEPGERKYKTAIICGEYSDKDISDLKTDRIVFLNATPLKNSKLLSLSGKDITVVIGDFSDWRNKSGWKSIVEANPTIKLIVMPGVADYIPNWTDYISGEPINQERNFDD